MLRNTYTHTVYPISGYKFGHKAPTPDKDGSAQARLARMKAKFDREGLRRSVGAVILVHAHGHPHVLLLQLGNSAYYQLPGGKLKPGEDEIEGLRRKLTYYLSPEDPLLATRWEVGECVGAWWRPNFDTQMYPYCPPHVTRPKELRRLYIVPLLDRACFACPRNFRVVAAPLFELYEGGARFGPMLASLPQMLCRFRLNIVVGGGARPAGAVAAAGGAVAAAVGGGAQQAAGGYDQQQQQQQQAQQQMQYQHSLEGEVY